MRHPPHHPHRVHSYAWGAAAQIDLIAQMDDDLVWTCLLHMLEERHLLEVIKAKFFPKKGTKKCLTVSVTKPRRARTPLRGKKKPTG